VNTPTKDYEVRNLEGLEGSIVATHRGDFLVIAAKLPDLSTILFQKDGTYTNCWTYRRTIRGKIEPRAAVTGHILSTWREVDVFGEMEKRLAGREKAYWQLLEENMKLKATLRVRGRRAKKKRG
jgi:hypothetical protein